MADEEPKTPISPSGLYNMSSLVQSDPNYDFSASSLGGLSEFTFMVWFYVEPTATIIFGLKPYKENNNDIDFIIKNTSLECFIDNSNGGVTTVSSPTPSNKGSIIHMCVTGSVSNNQIKIYRNGTLLNSAVMTYPNATTLSADIFSSELLDIAQLNMYNRELSESEVAEHYVYDDDTMTSGVLGFDAMTTAQKSGLIYSSSYTDTISVAGNEFTDKSGNNITLSPTPSLTGQQIYVYTDINDLPATPSNALPSNLPTIL